jgi:flavin reductase (DIM6/NTAB) family NADH-FMN oxidoreductase RutF
VEKREIGQQVFLYPMPVVIVGADIGDRPNFMPVAWVTRVSAREPWFAVAMNKSHATNEGIREHGEFGLSVPSVELVPQVDHCGLVSGKREDKSRCFSAVRGQLAHAPMAGECRLAMELRLVKTIDLESHDLFIGSVANAYADDDVLTDGVPDIEKLSPFSLTMPDNRYWATGEQVGRAWSDGRGWQPS